MVVAVAERTMDRRVPKRISGEGLDRRNQPLVKWVYQHLAKPGVDGPYSFTMVA